MCIRDRCYPQDGLSKNNDASCQSNSGATGDDRISQRGNGNFKIKNGLTLSKTIKTLYLNMKYIFMPFLFLLTFSVSAQTVISSAGKTTINGNYNVSWTIGEAVIHTISAEEQHLLRDFISHCSLKFYQQD